MVMDLGVTPETVTNVKTTQDGSVVADMNDGSSIAKKPDGSIVKLDSDGNYTVKTADGEEVTTIDASGNVKSTKVEDSLGLRMDMIAMGLDPDKLEKQPRSNAGKFAQDYVDNGMGTFKQGWDIYVASQAKNKNATPQQRAATAAFNKYNTSNKTEEDYKVYQAELKAAANMKDTKENYMNSEQALTKAIEEEYEASAKTPADKKKREDALYEVLKAKVKKAGDKAPKFDEWVTQQVALNKMTKEEGAALLGKGEADLLNQAKKTVKREDYPSDESYYKAINDEFIRLKRNPNQGTKPPDKIVMDNEFIKMSQEVAKSVNKKNIAEMTAQDWEKVDPETKEKLLLAWQNTKDNLSDKEKEAMASTNARMNALKNIVSSYDATESGLVQNLLNTMGQITGVKLPYTADISKNARLKSAINTAILQGAKSSGDRTSTKVIDLVAQELGQLSRADESVKSSFIKAIDDTISQLEQQKKAYNYGYYIMYNGDPIKQLKAMRDGFVKGSKQSDYKEVSSEETSSRKEEIRKRIRGL